MTDLTLNNFLSSGTHTQRLAFTPSPATPASGNSPSYFWIETDTSDSYAWNFGGAAWIKVNTGGAGTVTTTGSPASGNLTKFSGASSITSGDLSGDVTTSGTLAATIAANAVSTSKINNAAVTLAKIANAAANSKLLGSGATGSGSPYVELTLGTNLSISGTTLNATGGGSAPVTPTIRASNIQSSSAATYTVTWPTGTIAGDWVFIFYGGGFQANTPAGWSPLALGTGSGFNGVCFAKIMTAGDITAGSVVITPAGTFNAVLTAITLVGTTCGAVDGQPVFQQSGSGVTATSLVEFGFFSTSLILLFGGNRAANTAAASVVGSAQQQVINAANSSGVLSAGAITTPGIGNQGSFTFSSSGAGYYVCMVAVKGV